MRPNTIVLGFHDDSPPVDFFGGNDASPHAYKTDRFKDSFQLRNSYEARLAVEEYVEMIKDVIKMNKNVCICRGMSQLDKQSISK
jgi:potassium/chloride transporter 9